MAEIHRDLTRTMLAILCILLLIATSLYQPAPVSGRRGVGGHDRRFHVAVAKVTATAVWRSARSGGAADRTLAMLLLLVVPLWLAIDTIASHA